jgi:PAS domain S-box-containing protein
MTAADAESRRIEILMSYGVLDTAPELAYDEITQLIAAICQTPIAFISLVDGERQWLKSVHGADWVSTPRNIAFCTHAIEQRGLFVVEDAESDPRFAGNPLVCGTAGLRYYAGMPLVDAGGMALGALAVVDRVPRRLTGLQQQSLRVMAGQVMAQLEARRRQAALESALLQRERDQAAWRESEGRWRLLFERNPLPMFIVDMATLRFLAVNDAAVQSYGWSPSEFAALTLKDIRPPEDVPLLLAGLAEGHEAVRGGRIWRHRRKNGEVMLVDIRAHGVPFDGHPARLVLAEDVTLQVQATQALQTSELRWQRLFAASAIGIAAAGPDGRLSSVNPAFCQLLGRDEPELLGAPMLAFTHPDDAAACHAQLQRLAADEIESFTIEKRYLHPDGHARWARATVTLSLASELGGLVSPRQYVAVVQDIDAQRQAQAELSRQHDLVVRAGQLARLGGWQVLLQPGQTVHWTDELRDILDIPDGDLPDVASGLGMYLPGAQERITQALQACLQEGKPFDLELEMRTAAGRPLQVRCMGVALRDGGGQIIGARGALMDQSERLQAQQALRRSEERFRQVARATADAVWDWDLVEGTLWWNEGIHTLFGHDPAALEPGIGARISRIHPDDRQAVQAGIAAALAGNDERWRAEYRFARADGSHALVLDRGFVIRDDAGRGVRMVGGMTDLSAQREAEQRLHRQAALLDAARDAIVVRDLAHRIVYWNRGAERLFGWDAGQALGRHAPELLHEDEILTAQAMAEVLQRGDWTGVVKNRCRDGRSVMIDLRLSLLRDAAGQPEAVLAIQTDVTRRLALESQLQQSQRLEAVGQLTGGVAHDFNNLLTVILGNAELLAEMLADNPSLLPLARMTATAAERGAELTQRLLAFARKQPLQPQAVDAHQLLTSMDALLRRTLPESIELQTVRAAGLWPVLADPVQLESAVLNLVLNARDAMPEGGKITLETANAWIDQDYAEQHGDVLPGQYTLVSVSDTGMGMSAHTMAHAFEPFFTTKGVGRGTGLGLSMVYGFAKQSRGHVKLYSEPGHGTTVRVYLPRADQAARDSTAPKPGVHHELRGTATVLVVEDDDLVRRFATEMLRNLGYEVLAAEHGAAAVAVLQSRNDIDLLFTDVVMPGGMNGRQLADAARELHPGLKVLFTSGYTENAIVHHGRLDRGVELLTKPYRAVDLARKLRSVLA